MNTKILCHVLRLTALTALLSGCLAVYKAEIQQGNVITQEMIDRLRPGMTRNQVRFVLGTPLIADPFHQDRWDYYYFLKRANEDAGEAQRLTIIFKNDALATVQGDTKVKNGLEARPSKHSSGSPAPAKSDKSY